MKARILSIPRELVYVALLACVAFSLTLSYQLNSISIILLSVFYLCDKRLVSKVKSLSFNVTYFYLIYFIIHVLGLLTTENMQEGLTEVTVKLSFLLLPLIIFSEKISKDYLYQLFILFKYWMFLFALFLIYHKRFVIGGPLSTLPVISLYRLTGIHHAYFSLFFMFNLFFLFYQINSKKIGLGIGLLQALFFFFFIAVLGARIMFGVALLITLIFLSKKLIQLKGFQRVVFIVIFAFTSFFIYDKTDISEKFTRLSKIEWDIEKNIYNHQVFTFGYDESTSNTFEMRLIKWYCASEVIKDNLFAGVGTGDYNDVLAQKYKDIDFKKGMIYGYNTHNQYLEEFLKFGVFGGLFFIIFMTYIVYQAVKFKNGFLVSIIFTICAFMLIESIFERQHGVVFFSFFIPLVYLHHQSNRILKNQD